jgi:hypothetical protein
MFHSNCSILPIPLDLKRKLVISNCSDLTGFYFGLTSLILDSPNLLTKEVSAWNLKAFAAS